MAFTMPLFSHHWHALSSLALELPSNTEEGGPSTINTLFTGLLRGSEGSSCGKEGLSAQGFRIGIQFKKEPDSGAVNATKGGVCTSR